MSSYKTFNPGKAFSLVEILLGAYQFLYFSAVPLLCTSTLSFPKVSVYQDVISVIGNLNP